MTEIKNCALYMDGFNFSHNLPVRADGKKEGRWLNPVALAREVWPEARIKFAKYFSAPLLVTPVDIARGSMLGPKEQAKYWRALRTIPNLRIIEGHYEVREVRMPLAADPLRFVRVIRAEEKRSDVNLASHLLWDAARGVFDCALVASNDSDLREAIRIVARGFNRRVILMTPPAHNHPANFLRQVLGHRDLDIRRATPSAVRAAQFPDQLRDNDGAFSKPRKW